jgi:hypothetical protein
MESPSFKTMLLEMSLDQLNKSVIDVIRSRLDVVSIEILTGQELEKMSEEHDRHFRNLFVQIRKDKQDESA